MESIEQLTSILHVDREEWDAMAGDEVFWRHGWVAASEESSTLRNRLRYFVARDGAGIRAAAVCHVQEPGETSIGIDRILFGRFAPLARALRLDVSPVLVCGARVGLASHVRVRADVPQQERLRAIDSMIQAMHEAAHAGRRTLCFRNVREGETALEGSLRDRGFVRAAEMPGNGMDVVWSTFAEYVRDLKKAHPATAKGISHEINRSRSRNIVFRRLEHPGALEPRLHQLLCDHHRRLNGGEFPFAASFLRNLCERLGNGVVLFAALRDDLPIGVVIGFRAADTLFLPFVGIDHERRKDSFAYFNIAYNEPIRYAIETKIRSIYCGKLLYHVKLRRGFRVMPLYMYLRPHNPLHRALIRQIAAGQITRVQSMVRKDDAGGRRAEERVPS
jgi:predicted N-acyltransferase